jgi:hypothetical protein
MKTRGMLASWVWAAVLAVGVGCSSSSTGGSNDGGQHAMPPDATADAGLDAGHVADAMKKSDAPVMCAPQSIVDFKPVLHGQVGPYANACTVAQLTDLVNACFSDDMPACDSFVNNPANTACNNCWSGPFTQAAWAPFLYVNNPGQSTYTNVAGCIALSDPSALMCAQQQEYAFECIIAACEAACPVPTTGDPTDAINAFNNCIGEAECGVCTKYSAAADSCGAVLAASGPAAYCSQANMNSDDLLKYFLLACGPAPSDAGSGDASTDAH